MTAEVIGDGFIARHLRRHPLPHHRVTVLAAGVSRTSETAPEQFAREARLSLYTL